ncbi:MAG: ABC-F family ATP-binding cassette domain-containing protein [Ignavibacteria bacterium]|nr:ABC-F family ATP-binding cassette domain-containing protein [Ignavibacteria bacterium]
MFDDLTCMIGPHDRIGLVGSNGTGKTTILKIITGLVQADSGIISKARFVTVGYLPQEGVAVSGRTLYKEAESAFEDVLEVQRELEEAQSNLESLNPESEEYAETLEIYGELQHKLEDLDAFRMKSKVERVLMGLGFFVSDLERMTEEFSGGWQMRIELAKLLLREPSILLLDEPTNHLDLETLQWLEEYLRNYNGAVVLVSHDRVFLDSLCSRTIALSLGKMEQYAGNYSYYEQEYAKRRELKVQSFKNQQQRIKETQEFIDRFRYKATKARQVQSRIKQLEKTEIIEIEPEESGIRFDFPQPPASGRVVMELKDLSKSYGAVEVFENLDYKIERGDRIAVVGANGAGKSTLSRILAGAESFNAGQRIVGHNVTLSYFAQHQAEELDPSKEVLDTIEEIAEGEIRKKLRSLLGSFLFHDDDVFKKVSVLSGGEKSRLALAKMLLKPANFLILDEPTNHLDMKSKKVLQEALSRYDGSFLIVSHDRAFLEPIVNKVIEAGKGTVRTYIGSISDYLAKKREEKESAARSIKTVEQQSAAAPEQSDKERKRIEAERRQQLSVKLRPLKQKVEALEREIGKLESRHREIETAMLAPDFYKNGAEAKKIAAERKEVEQHLARAFDQWDTVQTEMDHVRNES